MNGYERRVLRHVDSMKLEAFHMTVQTAMRRERKAKLAKYRFIPAPIRAILLRIWERDGKFTAATLNLVDQGLLARLTESNEAILLRVNPEHKAGYKASSYYVLTPRGVQVMAALQPVRQEMMGAA